jgi:hypothetical protein
MTPLTRTQWEKVLTALIFSFISTFIATFLAAGGVQSTLDATLLLVFPSLVSAINATLYGLTKLFKEED